MGYKTSFVANITTISNKSNEIYRPYLADHRPQKVIQRIPRRDSKLFFLCRLNLDHVAARGKLFR